jgi:tRNA threonylcarbamoyladenosine biosynthesis protein TsaB
MELSIDTASEMASVALSQDGALLAECTWRCRRNHSVELLPTIDRLLEQADAKIEGVEAVFVSNGPGMYTGLRVGISTAQGIAFGLGCPAVGVGRLELDAYPHRAFPGAVLAVHKAGRGELAWAAFGGMPWGETSAPRLSKAEELAGFVTGPMLLVGEVDDGVLASVQAASAAEVSAPPGAASVRRAAVLAEVGFARLSAGAASDPALLSAVYLRPPAIGPQEPIR